MPQKVILVADPGIDTAFAIAIALHDPRLDVIGLLATAGNVSADQATSNVHILIDQLDPPKWPRLGAAPPVNYEIDGTALHGPDGLGGVTVECTKLHAPTQSDKLLVELVHEAPKEVTVVNLGPLTVFARALDRDPELPTLIDRLVCLGGAWHEPGNASATAEFHFACDPVSARRVLRSGAQITLIPLDVSRKIVFSPTDLLELPGGENGPCRFLRQIVPFGIRATANHYGVEGFQLKDVLGIFALVRPGALTTRAVYVDVESQGELTRGMSVVDLRPTPAGRPNVHLATGVDVDEVRSYIERTLSGGA
jgi:inosine-uridine nucleoside N-ribohydrolase